MTRFDPSKIVFPPHVAYREADTVEDLICKGLVPERRNIVMIGGVSNLTNYYAYEHLSRMCQQTYGEPLGVWPYPRMPSVQSLAYLCYPGAGIFDTSDLGLDLLAHGIGKLCAPVPDTSAYVPVIVGSVSGPSLIWPSPLVSHVQNRIAARHPLYRAAVFTHTATTRRL